MRVGTIEGARAGKSRPPVGRPQIDEEVRAFILRMSAENPLPGVPCILTSMLIDTFDLKLLRTQGLAKQEH